MTTSSSSEASSEKIFDEFLSTAPEAKKLNPTAITRWRDTFLKDAQPDGVAVAPNPIDHSSNDPPDLLQQQLDELTAIETEVRKECEEWDVLLAMLEGSSKKRRRQESDSGVGNNLSGGSSSANLNPVSVSLPNHCDNTAITATDQFVATAVSGSATNLSKLSAVHQQTQTLAATGEAFVRTVSSRLEKKSGAKSNANFKAFLRKPTQPSQ